jgi:hypothetical protein
MRDQHRCSGSEASLTGDAFPAAAAVKSRSYGLPHRIDTILHVEASVCTVCQRSFELDQCLPLAAETGS